MPVPPSYHAARHASALVDLSARGRIAVGGADRASYLQGLLTNDIEALSSGDGCYAAYLTPQGRLLADMQVVNLADELLLDVHPTVAAMLVDRLREFVFTEDVTVEDRTARWAAFGVHGPESARVVSEVVRPGVVSGLDSVGPVSIVELGEYPEHRHCVGQFEGVPVVAARSDETGEVGFILYADAGVGAPLKDALAKAGALRLDAATFDLLRVEAGRPAFPTDMNHQTIPLEAGIEDRAISMSKGCYVGQEVIIRILHRGQGRVGRRLVGLSFEPHAEPPDPGATLATPGRAEGTRAPSGVDGEVVGAVTTSVRSPALDRPIALGYVKRQLAESGTELVAYDGQRQLTCVISPRPFVPLPNAVQTV